ncbi:MAG: nucleotidyltransferase domain-containing protein [Candidatus Cloacimonetes bacterium]|nr:nucleotidyltransferase domain-containing protein [Candidatus Cloacimonadota bacterium]
MYSEKHLDIIKKIILQELQDVELIYLFGSYAKNTAVDDSDLDIAIILESARDWRTRKTIISKLYQKSGELGIMVDFLMKDLSSFKQEKSLPTISRVIEDEGVILWKKN